MRPLILRSVIILAALPAGAAIPTNNDNGSAADAARRRQDDPGFTAAVEAFEQHNYKAALEAIEAFLVVAPESEEELQARLLRARFRLKLRQWDQGVAELTGLMAAHRELSGRAELHEALGEVGLQQYKHRPLAVDHFGIAANLRQSAGEKTAAARDTSWSRAGDRHLPSRGSSRSTRQGFGRLWP